MKVLIVAKTRMANAVCVGAIEVGNGRSLRLLTPGGGNQPLDTAFEIGQLWDVDYRQPARLIPPHVEDVYVNRAELLQPHVDVAAWIKQHAIIWRGTPRVLFDGCLRFADTGAGYLDRTVKMPSCSTGFWQPDRPLCASVSGGKVYYNYLVAEFDTYPQMRAKYVGVAQWRPVIPLGWIVRVSLSRWWAPANGDAKRCWLQISGWYES